MFNEQSSPATTRAMARYFHARHMKERLRGAELDTAMEWWMREWILTRGEDRLLAAVRAFKPRTPRTRQRTGSGAKAD